MRTTVTIPADLLREVDELAGPRGRNRYLVEAVVERLARDQSSSTAAPSKKSRRLPVSTERD